MSPTIFDEPPAEVQDVRAGRLPARYAYRLQDVFMERLLPLLASDVSILDVGSGRSPTLAPSRRPAGCRYVGLDVSEHEMLSAAPGAYDTGLVHDITQPLPIPESERFDVVVSWQVLEHVARLDAALENLRNVLRPGGTMVAQLSGSYAAFALLARVMPHRVRVRAMARFLGHNEEEKFPTRYDRCHASALEEMLAPWTEARIVPFYRGATYFGMCRPLQRAYLLYEGAIEKRGVRNLATHYLLVARR